MTADEVRRIIRDEIRIALQVISSGAAGDNSGLISEDIQTLFPGMPTLTKRPIMRPYGFMSRAPNGTISVTAQQGEHPGNKLTLGHRDANVPEVQSGETMIYNEFGEQVYLSNGQVTLVAPKVQLGSSSASQPVPLGTILQTALETILNAIIAHTHTAIGVGLPTSAPLNAAAFSAVLASPVQDGTMNSKVSFTE